MIASTVMKPKCALLILINIKHFEFIGSANEIFVLFIKAATTRHRVLNTAPPKRITFFNGVVQRLIFFFFNKRLDTPAF